MKGVEKKARSKGGPEVSLVDPHVEGGKVDASPRVLRLEVLTHRGRPGPRQPPLVWSSVHEDKRSSCEEHSLYVCLRTRISM